MSAASKISFAPPSPEQFEQHLRAYPASAPTRWLMQFPLLVVAGLFVLSLVIGGPALELLPWLALIWLFGHNWYRTRRVMQLEANIRRSQEAAMMRRYPQALRESWRLLPQTTSTPMLHHQTVAMIAHCLDSLGCYDAAIVGYDYLLNRLPPNQPIAVHIGVNRANAVLGADRLSDADDAIRRLRAAVEPYQNTTIGANYRLAQLTQHVRTHHFAEGASENDDLIEVLRPLGVDAGYGHALMALCHYHRQDEDADTDTASAHELAKLWWERATLLLPADALVQRYPELAPLMEIQ